MFSEEGGLDILQLVLERGAVEGKVPDSIPGLKSSRAPHTPASARRLRWAVQLERAGSEPSAFPKLPKNLQTEKQQSKI